MRDALQAGGGDAQGHGDGDAEDGGDRAGRGDVAEDARAEDVFGEGGGVGAQGGLGLGAGVKEIYGGEIRW